MSSRIKPKNHLLPVYTFVYYRQVNLFNNQTKGILLMKTKIFAIALLSAVFATSAIAADTDMAAPADQNQYQNQQTQPQGPAALNLADNQQDQSQLPGSNMKNNPS